MAARPYTRGGMTMMKYRGTVCCVLSVFTLAAFAAKPDGGTINGGARIPFRHPLPSMRADGRQNGTYNNKEMGLSCILTTKDAALGEMLQQLRNVIWADRRLVFIDGKKLMCSNNWIRDHVHEMKGYCHWEYDIGSFLQFILDTQRADGCCFELIKQMDDFHWKMVDPDCYRLYPEDNLSLVRLELEADIEYLVVEGSLRYYRVTGDEAWLKSVLPKLEKGIDYITGDPKRWDKEHGLVKRPFTIDTWDFTFDPNSSTNRRVEARTPMSIMHGDNSGVYQAMCQLAWMNDHFGNAQKAGEWRNRADTLKANMFTHLWNGKFFIHQLHLGHPGLDNLEKERLSLSNTYDMNRGVTTVAQSRSIIEEYMLRRKTTHAFAEWFSIDPPYEHFGHYKPGEYVNGAISPFAAGELAKAAFRSGYEKYGWDILLRFEDMMRQNDGKVYFLYSPKDCQPQGRGPSAWGAASLLSAIDEGLAGVEDIGCGYKAIAFSPRFPVTGYTELRYITGYEKSGKVVDIRYIRTDAGMRYQLRSPAREIQAHILLPEGKRCARLWVDGKEHAFTLSKVGDSSYADFNCNPDGTGKTNFELFF